MRYLKVIAEDRSKDCQADTVRLYFFEQHNGKDLLVREAYAVDNTADGIVDWQVGDVDNDGKRTFQDERLLKVFATTFLKLGWFNRRNRSRRYLKIFSENFGGDCSPDTVRLHFHEGIGQPTDRTLTSTAASYDTDNNGTLDWVIHFDVDNDGDIDATDQELVSLLSRTYLEFKWQ